MNWKNLRANKCPKDGSPLVRDQYGYRCAFVDAYYKSECTFFITKKRAEEIKDGLKKP